MDWKEYENITKYIYETLGSKAGVKIVGHGNTCKIKGKSGVYHQIDVLTKHTDGIHDYQTAIECKYWKEKVNKEVVMKLAEIIDDAGIHKGVIISQKGFTKDGISFAKHKNIGLIELREFKKGNEKEQDITPIFPIGTLIINNNIEIKRPEILNIEIDFVDPNQKSEKINPNLMSVKEKDGNEVSFDNYLTSFRNILHLEIPDKIVEKYHPLKNAILINKATKEEIHINGFTLKGKLIVKNENSTCQFEIIDEVWMIMKSLFEKKSFTISKTGLIKKERE